MEFVDDIGFVEFDEDAVDGHNIVPKHFYVAVLFSLDQGQATFAGSGVDTENGFGGHLTHHEVEFQFIPGASVFAGNSLQAKKAVRGSYGSDGTEKLARVQFPESFTISTLEGDHFDPLGFGVDIGPYEVSDFTKDADVRVPTIDSPLGNDVAFLENNRIWIEGEVERDRLTDESVDG